MIKKNSTSGESSPIMEEGAVYSPHYKQVNNYFEKQESSAPIAASSTETLPNFSLSCMVRLNLGTETLAAARFLKKIKRNNISLDEISILIDGQLTCDSSPIAIQSSPSKLLMDGYIRNFTIDSNGKEASVGGSNATLEDIAADNISIEMPAQLFDEVSDGYSQIYLIDKAKLSQETLEVLHEARHFESAISAARFTKTPAGLSMLIEYLKGLKNPYFLSLVTEGFRNFDNIYKSNKHLTVRAIQELDRFISLNKGSSELGDAVVFATESLGYIFRSSSVFNKNVASILSGVITSEHCNGSHKHLPWAASVAMDFQFHDLHPKERDMILEKLQDDQYTKKILNSRSKDNLIHQNDDVAYE